MYANPRSIAKINSIIIIIIIMALNSSEVNDWYMTEQVNDWYMTVSRVIYDCKMEGTNN